MSLFSTALFTEGVLPFVLVFVLVFAVLQKSKVLGEGKMQIDALISLAIALILVAIPAPRNLIVAIIPWLAVALVVMLIFFMTYGFAASTKDGYTPEKWVKNMFAVLAIIFVVGVVVWASGFYKTLLDWYNGDNTILGTVLMIVIIGVAFWVVVGKSDSKDSK